MKKAFLAIGAIAILSCIALSYENYSLRKDIEVMRDEQSDLNWQIEELKMKYRVDSSLLDDYEWALEEFYKSDEECAYRFGFLIGNNKNQSNYADSLTGDVQ